MEKTHIFIGGEKFSLYCQLDQMLQAHDGLKDARDLKDLIGWVGVAMNLKPEEVISKAGQHLNLWVEVTGPHLLEETWCLLSW